MPFTKDTSKTWEYKSTKSKSMANGASGQF